MVSRVIVWEGLGCVGFVYKIVEITAVGSNNRGGPSGWALMYGTEWSGFESCRKL